MIHLIRTWRIHKAASLMGKREAVRKRARELRVELNLDPHPGLAA